LFDAMLYSADFPEGFRAAVELRGIRLGPGRQPLSDNQRVDKNALAQVLRCILADFGLVDTPAEGCAPRVGTSEQDRVAQLTAKVLKQLRAEGVIS
jgi:4-hydroxy-tetrahydrodipicolinate synthase